MTAPIRVTVDGEPVTREVTLEQVRAYLTAKGWCRDDNTHGYERWLHECGPGDGDAAPSWIIFPTITPMGLVVERVAAQEQRHPSAVLRAIAGGAIWATATHAADHVFDMLSGRPKPEGRDVIARELEYWHERGVHDCIASERAMKTPAERRADEIEADRMETFGLNLRGVLHKASDAYEAVELPEWRRTEAAAWLIIAQRMLAREAAR